MPWLIAPQLADDQIDWQFRPGEAMPFGYTSPSTAPNPDDFDRTYTLIVQDGRTALPDLAKGPCENMIVVSERLRELIEATDPERHFFLPLRIVFQNGVVSEDRYFWFKLTEFLIGALIVEASEIRPIMRGEKVLIYLAKTLLPKLGWRQSNVGKRHVWSDIILPSHLVVSDELYAQMKKCEMGNFVAKESRFDSAQSSCRSIEQPKGLR